jgi:hypothetical protein
MSKTLSKMNLISVVQQLPKEDIETIQGYVEMIEEENQELKLELSGYRQAILNNEEMLGLKEQNEKLKKQLENKYEKVGTLTSELLYEENTKLINQQKEFIKYLEDEKDRLIKGTSHYYIDSFDRQHAVNETIYDEVDIILQKYKSIIGDINNKK